MPQSPIQTSRIKTDDFYFPDATSSSIDTSLLADVFEVYMQYWHTKGLKHKDELAHRRTIAANEEPRLYGLFIKQRRAGCSYRQKYASFT